MVAVKGRNPMMWWTGHYLFSIRDLTPIPSPSPIPEFLQLRSDCAEDSRRTPPAVERVDLDPLRRLSRAPRHAADEAVARYRRFRTG